MITDTGTKIANGMAMIDLLNVAVDDLWNQIVGATDIDHETFVEIDILRMRIAQLRQLINQGPRGSTDQQWQIAIAQVFGVLQSELTTNK